MTVTLRMFGLAIFAVPAFAVSGATADPAASNKSGLSANALSSPSALSNDPLIQKSQSDDLSERVDALESSRAAVSQNSKSPISLSISGWVTQEVTITRQ